MMATAPYLVVLLLMAGATANRNPGRSTVAQLLGGVTLRILQALVLRLEMPTPLLPLAANILLALAIVGLSLRQS